MEDERRAYWQAIGICAPIRQEKREICWIGSERMIKFK